MAGGITENRFAEKLPESSKAMRKLIADKNVHESPIGESTWPSSNVEFISVLRRDEMRNHKLDWQ
jgi:hypothetical protein